MSGRLDSNQRPPQFIAVRYPAAPRPEPLILQQKDTNITIIEKMMLPYEF